MATTRRAPGDGPPRLAMLIPTTRKPISVLELKQRPQLPASHVLTAGNFRALAISRDYDQLVSPVGPVGMRLNGHGASSWELRLSDDFESGRSWELPVALLHLLVDRGYELVADPADAELLVFATGAVDADLKIADQPYYLGEKLAVAAEMLAHAATTGTRVLTLLPLTEANPLPPVADQEQLAAKGVVVRSIRTVDEAVAAIAATAPARAGTESPNDAARVDQKTGRRLLVSALLVCTAVLALGSASWMVLTAPKSPKTPQVSSATTQKPTVQAPATQAPIAQVGTVPPATIPSATVPAATAPPSAPSAQAPAAVVPAVEAATAQKDVPPATSGRDQSVVIEEHRAPPGRTCIQVMFASVKPVMQELRPRDGAFAPSKIAGLCGLVIRGADRTSKRTIEVDAALIEASIPDPGLLGQKSNPPMTSINRLMKDKVVGPRRYVITTRDTTAAGAQEWQFTHELID